MKTPDQYPAASPYLAVNDAEKAIAFYTAAFGAEELYRLTDAATGKIGHAEILINGSHFMLAEENPQWGNQSPLTLGGTPVRFCLMVENADAAIARASAAGAKVEMPAADMFYGFRAGAVSDPFGYRWMIQHQFEKVSPEEMQKRWDAMVQSGTAECKGAEK